MRRSDKRARHVPLAQANDQVLSRFLVFAYCAHLAQDAVKSSENCADDRLVVAKYPFANMALSAEPFGACRIFPDNSQIIFRAMLAKVGSLGPIQLRFGQSVSLFPGGMSFMTAAILRKVRAMGKRAD